MEKVLSVFKLKFTYFILAVGLLWVYAKHYNAERSLKVNYKNVSVEPIDTLSIYRDHVVKMAVDQIGAGYTEGGTTQSSGFDCSGLVLYAYKDALLLPRTTSQLAQYGNAVPLEKTQKGDLLFFESFFPGYRDVGHVGIVVHSDEVNMAFVHASSEGVRIDSLKNPAYKLRFLYARSML